MKKIFLVLIVFVGLCDVAKADVKQALNKVIKSFNGASNINKSYAALNQKGGLYSPGSATVRLETSNYNLLYFTPPSLDISCNGIDLNLGALSHISTENFKKAFRNIVSNSVAIGLKVGLAELSPRLEGSVSELQALVEEASRHSFNSCNTAYAFMGGILPKSEAAKKTICAGLATGTNGLSDWAKANQECGKNPKAYMNNPDVKKLQGDSLIDDFNLVWKALEKTGLSRGKKELFMSVCGTMIVKAGGDGKQAVIEPFRAIGKQEDMVKILTFGTKDAKLSSNVSLYHCKDPEKCLKIETKEITKNELIGGIYEEVLSLLNSIRDKAQGEGTKLSESELYLIENTSIPVLRMISIQFNKHGSHISNELIAEYVAEDMAIKYLISITDFVVDHADRLKAVQANGSLLDEFQSKLHKLRSILNQRRVGYIKKLNHNLDFISQLERLESQNIALITQGVN